MLLFHPECSRAGCRNGGSTYWHGANRRLQHNMSLLYSLHTVSILVKALVVETKPVKPLDVIAILVPAKLVVAFPAIQTPQ